MPLSRRALVSRSAWALPVVTLAVAAPAASASGPPSDDLGAFQLVGRCPVASVIPPHFVLTAGAVPLPAGTTVTLASTGAQTRYVTWDRVDGADQVLFGRVAQFALTVDLDPGASITFRASAQVSSPFELTGTVDPAGDAIGTGSKPTATITTNFFRECDPG